MATTEQRLFHNPSDDEFIEQQLQDIRYTVKENPAEDGSGPATEGWEDFLAKHPNYVSTDDLLARQIAHKGRELLADLEEDLAKIGGALIRIHLDDEEITKVGNNGRD
jgi:thiamine kinase-like enzyme